MNSINEVKNHIDLKQQIITAYSEDAAQEKYRSKAENGLWDSEQHFITKYWNPDSTVLDVGCGTGRTTLGLYKQGFKVTGVDLVPALITIAKQVSEKNNSQISYTVGDATKLEYPSESFDNALFSNLGWPQIPDTNQRLKALQEIHRILKPKGIFILVTPRRIWISSFFWFWVKQWIKYYLLRPLGFSFKEKAFGDRFYDRETKDTHQVFATEQYIFIPSVTEVSNQLHQAGFVILETNDSLQISARDTRSVRPLFYIAQKL
jgi:ubiquinone/menaquinone biosynthesis C-methylase UbiE